MLFENPWLIIKVRNTLVECNTLPAAKYAWATLLTVEDRKIATFVNQDGSPREGGAAEGIRKLHRAEWCNEDYYRDLARFGTFGPNCTVHVIKTYLFSQINIF